MCKTFRKLTDLEIETLKQQHCTSDDWSAIEVAEAFTPEYIFHTRFSGKIRMGVFEKEFILPGGFRKHSGLRHVSLHNCTLENNVLIENVSNYIANYNIGENSFIQNVNVIVVEGKSSFGNGTEVSVLCETGGREVPIYNKLSAHLAYIIALYRHRPVLIGKLREMIAAYAEKHTSEIGYIGKNVEIINTGTIKNVCIGDFCEINGASKLENGTINSNENDPVKIGCNVMAEDFIVSSGAHISDGVVMVRCFIGQACSLSHLFSAHDSLFFSNCQGENGEACAIFAGPYTVSMHKSSLLIAGMFSFLNAGSGSNQSNHMYKLGPIHQGIVERGSKTTSDSYILWPAKIGAFSLVMGRHVRHPDTSDLPFSYLIEKGNESYLVPGVNLKSVGTIRDAQKWPKRDKRKDPEKLDNINFNLLSPYTIQKMLTAIEVLRSLQRTSGETSEVYSYQSANIHNGSLLKGILLYSKAINKFLGNSIIKRLEITRFKDNDEIRKRLKPTTKAGNGEWLDLSGLIAPKSEIDKLISDIESEKITSLDEINDTFTRLHQNYYDMEWTWAYEIMQKWYDKDISQMKADDIIEIVNIWREAVVSLDDMLYADAKKEFSITAKTGFGVDGNSQQKNIDFEQVRGAFDSNTFVQTVNEHIRAKTALGNELIERISSLQGKI
ncbi:DUF4954 family protein [Coprobacter tertius]|uniref:DUF4954 family protein n=1 Tax=Coprobacter tertius TaxID=2944915 RepID=A0ABT1MIV0_9BACT|nr:DUF4954 family protein [Coprobacter tertius]MCP9611633.1 DUF4954 family protein [Coprobacter tertius]